MEFETPDDSFVVVFYRYGTQKLSGTAQKEEKTAQKTAQKEERINALLEYCKEPRELMITELRKETFGMQDMKNDDEFFAQVVQLFRDAKRKMNMAVNMAMVYFYYEAGRMIIDEEQNDSERAAYGKYILHELFDGLWDLQRRNKPEVWKENQ